MALKKKSPKDICPRQEEFPTTADGLITNTKPTDYYIDYPCEAEGNFEVPQAHPGHDCLMYRSTTKGKPRE